MKLSDYGLNTNVYELMTWLFPGVRFGEFHEKMDPEHFSETTGKCSADKTKYWIDIENEFQKYSSKPSDFLYFIEFLSEYKASGKDNIVFNQCFPHNGTKNSVFSNKILFDKLANPKEIEQLLKDCDILNGHTLKGGLFLYCARILDSKFLSYFYKKGTNTENIIYKLLKHFDSQIASNKPKFPVSSIFNESNSWRNDWEATYDNTEYRFGWQKDKDEHWQTLYKYKPKNPYQYFLHECQTRYTLVRIGYESTPSSSIKRAKDIKKFEQYSEKGLSEIFTKLLRNNGENQESIIREFYEERYHSYGFSKKDYEGNILIGIETKDGAQKFTPAFFIPKDFEMTIKEINSAKGHKKSEKETQHSEYKLAPYEITDLREILSKLYIYDKQIDELKNYLHIFTAEELREINKIISKVIKISVNDLTLEQEEVESLQNKNENPYKLLKILGKRKILNKLSKSEKNTIREFTKNRSLQKTYKTLEFLTSEKVQTYLSKRDRERIKKFSSNANTKMESLDTPHSTEDSTTLHDRISENDVLEKVIPSSSDFIDDILEKQSKTFKDHLNVLKRVLSKEPTIGEEKITKYIERIQDDYTKAINKTSFITTLENDIINFDKNCSDKELSDNYYVKKFLNSEISLPNTTVHIMFRELLKEIIKYW